MTSLKLRLGAAALMSSAWMAAAASPDATASAPEFGAQIILLQGMGEKEPVRATSFVLGDTVLCAFLATGCKTGDNGAPRVSGSWEVVTPNGKVLPISGTTLSGTNWLPRAPGSVPLSPVGGWRLGASEPSGCYRVRLSVTDEVSRASAQLEAPLYVFLTPGAKELITAPVTNAPMALDTTLLAPGFWSMSRDNFAASTWIHGFAWVSEAHDGLRSIAPGVTFLDQSLAETKVAFVADRPAEVSLSFYNRGDKGLIPNAQFTNRMGEVLSRLKKITGQAPQDMTPSSAKSSSTLRQSILVWKGKSSLLRLECAWSMPKQEGSKRREFMPEYINMVMQPASNAVTRSAMAGTQTASSTAWSLKRNVKRIESGDVYIDGIPMVDQGAKGYCAAACAERILSYYGTDVDQHELAQRMLMQTGGGASFDSLVNGLRSIAHTLNVKMKIIMEQDARSFERLVENYNKTAKRAGAKTIDLYARQDSANANTNSIWSQFNSDLFLKSRLQERISIERFFKQIKDKVNEGIPLCQCCIIGILPEEAKLMQDPGGHMRLIVGYNEKTREVLYSDSWGAGHERKRMKLGDTFAITTGLFTLEPK
jgi:hypothetical protein